jgi:hypothetical protein
MSRQRHLPDCKVGFPSPSFKSPMPSQYLLSHWKRINELAFSGALPEIADIGWHETAPDEGSLDVFGGYSVRANAIGITAELRRAEEIEARMQTIRSKAVGWEAVAPVTDDDLEVVSAVVGLLAHEMAHQAAHHFDKTGSHGEVFVNQASKIAAALDLPEVHLKNAAHWPDVLPAILRERSRQGGAWSA